MSEQSKAEILKKLRNTKLDYFATLINQANADTNGTFMQPEVVREFITCVGPSWFDKEQMFDQVIAGYKRYLELLRIIVPKLKMKFPERREKIEQLYNELVANFNASVTP